MRTDAPMDGSRGERFQRLLDSGGTWDNPLPRPLRIAAELNFGTFILVSILAVAKAGIVGAFMFFPAALMYGLIHTRGATSPAAWWFMVVIGTIVGAFMCFVALVADP